MRAEAEELYGQRLGDIAPAADKVSGGFSRDDGASVRKVRAYLVLSRQMSTSADLFLLFPGVRGCAD